MSRMFILFLLNLANLTLDTLFAFSRQHRALCWMLDECYMKSICCSEQVNLRYVFRKTSISNVPLK